MSQELPAPLVPPECDLQDYRFMPIDIVRLFQSEFHALADDSAWRAGMTLWLKSYHQVPAASVPDDDAQLARAAEFGRDVKKWRKVKDVALHGWVKCSDGRLYHPVVAEKALEGWIEKLRHRKSSAAGNAKRYGAEFDPSSHDRAIEAALGMLAALNPESRILRIRTPTGRPTGSATGTPADLPLGSQETSKGQGQVRDISEEAKASSGASASNGSSENRDAGKPEWWPKRDRYGRVLGEISDKLVFDVGKAVLGLKAGGQITRIKKAYRFDMRAVLEMLLRADETSHPPSWFAAALKKAEQDEPIVPMHEIYPEREYRDQ